MPSTPEGEPNPPWSSAHAAYDEIEALRAAAAYEHHLFAYWHLARGMGGRNNMDAHQASSTSFLAKGAVRSCYENYGDRARLRELADAGAIEGFLTLDQWLDEHGEAGASRKGIETLVEDVETIALMRWAFAHEARMAAIKPINIVTDMRRTASEQQVERMKACARGGVSQVAHYAMYAAAGSLRVLSSR
jgi:hypothetical protein